MDYAGDEIEIMESVEINEEERTILMNSDDEGLKKTVNIRSQSLHDFNEVCTQTHVFHCSNIVEICLADLLNFNFKLKDSYKSCSNQLRLHIYLQCHVIIVVLQYETIAFTVSSIIFVFYYFLKDHSF